jgi:hypothetical protein
MRPLRRGSLKSIAVTAHAFGSCGAPRLPRPKPDSREANAQGEMGRAEVQPWEEGQRIYRQPLETHCFVEFYGSCMGERSAAEKEPLCQPCEQGVE